MRKWILSVFALLLGVSAAFAISQARTAAVTPKPGYICVYVTGNLCGGETLTRASSANFFGSNGLLQAAANNVPRFDYGTPGSSTPIGMYIENTSATNVVLYNRDLSNAAWTATNITEATNAIGIDGVANAASTLTASAGNGEILQAIPLSSSSRVQSSYIQRKTGTGEVDMTTDGGTTWTAVTCSGGFTNIYGTCDTTSQWVRVLIPTQAGVTNPSVGFRIVTNGDAVIVDGVQNETTNSANPLPSSVLMTTTASVSRSPDVVQTVGTAASLAKLNFTFIFEGSVPSAASGSTSVFLNFVSNSQDIIYQLSGGLRAFTSGTLSTPSSAFAGNTLTRVGITSTTGITYLGSSQNANQPNSKASSVSPASPGSTIHAGQVQLCGATNCHVTALAIYDISLSPGVFASKLRLGTPYF